jgi:SAM-dependent methyltransferase
MTEPAGPTSGGTDVWEQGDAYEAYVGRWSRQVAARFVRWLRVPDGRRWLDAGCGTGALTSAITHASQVIGVDPSPGFLRGYVENGGTAVTGDAAALPFPDGVFDAVVSGLTLNFVPRPEAAVAGFARVAAPGATVAAYVWDYAGGMQMLRRFWDAAIEIDPSARALDEGPRFPICHARALAEAWMTTGFLAVTTTKIEIPTVFRTFDDFWRPFLGGQGPAPAYLATRTPDERVAIREALLSRLGPDTIALTAAAWAVRGIKDI